MAIGFGVYLSFEDTLSRKAITIIVGFTMLIAVITAVRGMIQLYKGRNGEKNSKFIIALIGNGLGILYLILTIITAIKIIPKVL
jgi:hypothetical protein